jgi:enoyl-CoA hydratase
VPVDVAAPADHVTVVTIDRPERRNAVDREMVEAIRDAARNAGRALVLTGAGGHFCSGADLTTLEDAGFAALVREAMEALAEPGTVTIAAVEGAALGAGTQLAAGCDLRVASASARFGIPAGKLGVALDAATVGRLSAVAGPSAARAMLVGGDVLDGEAAHRLGFVQRLGSLDDALAWAGEIARLAPLTLRAHQEALEGRDSSASVAAAWSSADVQEGLAAFREKRAPDFEGR